MPLPGFPSAAAASRPSRFLADCGELVLRVRGRGHPGRIVRLRSAKCTIGSAAGCTLRLRAAGVAPLSCWVLRGRSGAVIRHFHGDATLNGAAFNEAALQSGDRLRLNAVELEVVECGAVPPSPATNPFPPTSSEDATAELESRLALANEKIARLENEARQGFQSSIVAADRADQLRDALAAAHEQLAEACRELTASQEMINRQAVELEELRLAAAERSDDVPALAEQLDAARRQCHQLQAASAQRQAETQQLWSQLAAAEAERDSQSSRLSELSCFLSRQQEDCARLETELTETRTRFRAAQQSWEEELTQLQQRLYQREAELEAARDSAATHSGAMTLQMNQLRADAQGSEEHWQAQCEVLEAQLADAQAELARCREESSQREVELRQQAAEQGRQAAEQIESLTQQLAQAAELQQHLEAANDRLADVDQLRQQLDAERAALAVERERLAQCQQELHDRQRQIEQQPEIAAAPVPPLADDSPRAEDAIAAEAAEDLPAAAAEIAPVESPQPLPMPASPRAAVDDEESIESYMSRLLQRVRGDTPGKGAGGGPAASAQAAPPQTASNPTSDPDALGVMAGEDYVPRTAAPELSSDLSTMRDLANSAARTAIERHVRKSTVQQSVGRLLAGSLALAAGLVLAYWAVHQRSLAGASGALFAAALGSGWIITAFARLVCIASLSERAAAKT